MIALNGHQCKSLTLFVPKVGAWLAEVSLAEAVDIEAGPVTITAGAVELTGATLAEATGRFLVRTLARVVGGAGGWRKSVAKRHYHNDAGVTHTNVLNTTADAVGETLAAFTRSTRLPADYVRTEGVARHTLQRLAPAWWVDFDGVTHVDTRAASTPGADAQLQTFDPIASVAEYKVEAVTDLAIGCVVSDRLPRSFTVEALEIVYTDKLRAHAWLV